MTQKPEANFWKKLREKMPKSWHTTRIENRYGGGVPDVHVCAEGVPFWIELKTTKTNRVNVSAHQVAWNFAYCQSGGVSFYLVKALSSSNLYLFDGVHGRGLMEHGLKSGRSGSGEVGSGTIVPCLWSGDSWSGLLDHMLEVGRGRVIVGVGSGSGSSRVGAAGSGPKTWKEGSMTWQEDH